jgi:hypothetical protein
VYELYADNCTHDDVLKVGQLGGDHSQFYAHLYLGLYYEAHNNVELARDYLVKAADKYQIDDYMWYLAQVHKKIRGW